MELRIALVSIWVIEFTCCMASTEVFLEVAADLSRSVTQIKFRGQNWNRLHSDIKRYSDLMTTREEDASVPTQRHRKVVESLTAFTYEALYDYLAMPDLDHVHLSQLDPLVHLYWEYLTFDSTMLSHARIISELIASSFADTTSEYENDDMESLSFAFPAKAPIEFILHVATSVPGAYSTQPSGHVVDKQYINKKGSEMIACMSEQIKTGSESRVDLASWFNSVLFVYDSIVSPGDETTIGQPLTMLCSDESQFINHIVHDLRGAHTVRQRVSLERFCLGSLSLKVRFGSLFLPHIQQSFMVAPYMRGQTRIVLDSHAYDIQPNLDAVSRLSREELLAGNIVVEYKGSILGFERRVTIDEYTWLDRLIPKLFSDPNWFDETFLPRSDLLQPYLFVAVGKLIGLGLIRERLSIKLHSFVLQRLLTISDDEWIDVEYTSTSIDALVHGIFSIVPRDAFSRFFYNDLELMKVFSGNLYDGDRQ